MTADIEQNDLLFGDHQREGDTVGVGQACRIAAGEFAAERVQFQAGLERVGLQVCKELGETEPEVGMLTEEFTGLWG
jgi:hypothetical protein